MTLSETLAEHTDGHYTVLILDNEVTVDAFVSDPPQRWIRLVYRDGAYRVADGYPVLLTGEQARKESRYWDRVSGLGMIRCLNEVGDDIDLVVLGNNAGQGLPLAGCLAEELRADRAVIIYADFLAQDGDYRDLGFRKTLRRSDLVSNLLRRAKKAGKPLTLVFLNTIQHDARTYHAP